LKRKTLRRLPQTTNGINVRSAERNKFGIVCAAAYGVIHFTLFNYTQGFGLKKLPDLKGSMSDGCKRLGPNKKENENSGT